MHDGNHFDSVSFAQNICAAPEALKGEESSMQSHSHSVSVTHVISLVPQDVNMDASAIGRAIRAMYGPLKDTAEECDACGQQYCGKCVKVGCKNAKSFVAKNTVYVCAVSVI